MSLFNKVKAQQKIAEMSTEERLAHQAQAWKQKSEETPAVTTEPTPQAAPTGFDGIKYRKYHSLGTATLIAQQR